MNLVCPSRVALAELNSLGFETLFGYRTIALSSGDIAEVDANLRIISTHANPESPPTGGALRSLGLVLTNSDLEPVVLLAPHSLLGTWRTSVGTDPLLVLRVPGTHSMDEATARTTYERAVKSVFTALASMELDGHAFDRVAMTVLGGSRGYEIAYVVHTLCTQAHRWLERSRSTRSFQIVVGETAHLDTWADALDEVLGRHVEDGANDRVLEAWRPRSSSGSEAPSSTRRSCARRSPSRCGSRSTPDIARVYGSAGWPFLVASSPSTPSIGSRWTRN